MLIVSSSSSLLRSFVFRDSDIAGDVCIWIPTIMIVAIPRVASPAKMGVFANEYQRSALPIGVAISTFLVFFLNSSSAVMLRSLVNSRIVSFMFDYASSMCFFSCFSALCWITRIAPSDLPVISEISLFERSLTNFIITIFCSSVLSLVRAAFTLFIWISLSIFFSVPRLSAMCSSPIDSMSTVLFFVR